MRKLIASLAVAFGTLVLAAPASADIVIRFTPATTHINVGDSAAVEMTISGLDAEILSAFDINMLFNNAVVTNNIGDARHRGAVGTGRRRFRSLGLRRRRYRRDRLCLRLTMRPWRPIRPTRSRF